MSKQGRAARYTDQTIRVLKDIVNAIASQASGESPVLEIDRGKGRRYRMVAEMAGVNAAARSAWIQGREVLGLDPVRLGGPCLVTIDLLTGDVGVLEDAPPGAHATGMH